MHWNSNSFKSDKLYKYFLSSTCLSEIQSIHHNLPSNTPPKNTGERAGRRPEPGARSLDPGAWSPEPAARSPEPGARSLEPGARSLDPGPRTELLSAWWRIWHHCCPHNELQCESRSNYDSFRWLTGGNWTWIFHNLHLLFKWEIILESHANFCHDPAFSITVIVKVSEGALKMRGDEMINANANYFTSCFYSITELISVDKYRPLSILWRQ